MSSLIIRQDSEKRCTNAPTCPDCGDVAKYSAGLAVARCLKCGWVIYLTPAENRDVLNAVIGIADTPLDAFFLEATRQRRAVA